MGGGGGIGEATKGRTLTLRLKKILTVLNNGFIDWFSSN